MSNTSDPTLWMWAQACDLASQAERLQRQFFRPTASRSMPAAWEPPADVFEDEREIVVVIAMPGVTSERMQILSEPGVLIVRGSRPLPLVGPGHSVRRLEIPHGTFERRILLPAGRLELEPPELLHGCLILRLIKSGAEWR
jgi:HSP20 family protein